jgi:phosphatidate phosphatase APP1
MSTDNFYHKAMLAADNALDQAVGYWRENYTEDWPVRVVPYHGYGTRTKLWLGGRVLLRRQERPAPPANTPWGNLAMMLRRYASLEVPRARVRATVYNQSFEATSNEEGYINFEMDLERPLPPGSFWHTVTLELLEPRGAQYQTTFEARVQVPQEARFGVISDIDDTIIHTGATNLLRHAHVALFNNAWTRSPFPGVEALYNAFHKAHYGKPTNPFWYVSSSPWNLYGLFTRFLKLNNLPSGAIYLKDFGIEAGKLIKSSHNEHKRSHIERILATYPDMPFILVGDSGQQDPEIYASIAQENPGRILSIYIRDISRSAQPRVNELAAKLTAIGVPMVLAADSGAIAQHAAALGLISSLEAAQVSRTIAQEASLSPTEQVIGESAKEDQGVQASA